MKTTLESIKNRVLKPALRLGSRCKRPTSTDCTARCFLPLAKRTSSAAPIFMLSKKGLSAMAAPVSPRTRRAFSRKGARFQALGMTGALWVMGTQGKPVPAWKTWSTTACSPPSAAAKTLASVFR
jgi:hypothetical protein